MPDELQAGEVTLAKEKVSRRGLFQFGAKLGVGLVAFVPALGILLQNAPGAQAATDIPNYILCSRVVCVNNHCSYTQPYSCHDSVYPTTLCCCSTVSCSTACTSGC